ncbi:unnamed protein product, partial [Allacma fusca]
PNCRIKPIRTVDDRMCTDEEFGGSPVPTLNPSTSPDGRGSVDCTPMGRRASRTILESGPTFPLVVPWMTSSQREMGN